VIADRRAAAAAAISSTWPHAPPRAQPQHRAEQRAARRAVRSGSHAGQVQGSRAGGRGALPVLGAGRPHRYHPYSPAAGYARRIQDQIADCHAQQENELWHLLILEELIARSGRPQSRIKFFRVPQAIAFVYYQLSLLLFVAHPAWSYRLNADFEDHAEHEYMTMVAEHPDWEHPVRIRVR
jgi:hypothetical protein